MREVFSALREPIYRYMLAVNGSSIDAEDLTQETFVRLFEQLRKGRAIGHPRAWLFRTAHNLAVDSLRHMGRRTAGLELLPAGGEDYRDPDPGAERSLLAREYLDGALARLSPQERRCMELRTEGLCYREIGKVLGIRIPTVQTVLGRAVRKLVDGSHASVPA